MATIDTIANNYDSDQDEEYAPAGGASSDSSDSEAEGEVDEDEGSASKKKRGKKRKASAKTAPLTLKKRALDFSKSRKKKKEDQIGAAVLSDEEEEEEESQVKPKHEQVQDEEEEEPQDQTQQTYEQAQQLDDTSETPVASTTKPSSLTAAEAKLTDSSASTSTSTPATSSAASTSTSSSYTSTSTAPSKATSLAALMAQINKKPSGTAKAPVKKSNPWDKPKPASKLESLMSTVPDITKPNTTTSKDIDERMKETHTTIKEVATFAGSQIHITRTIEKGSEEEAKHKAAKAARSNLDSILDAIKGKRELTTVDKSKLDWQVSKEKEGDAHELQQFTKNGYVSHMAFLKRAETREAEILRTRRAGGDRAERKAQLNMSELDD